jgi:hypothetical protein
MSGQGIVTAMKRRSLVAWLGSALVTVFGGGRLAASQTTPSYPPPMPPEARARWDKERARLLAVLPYPRVEVPGTRALAEWERLREEGKGWPVIIGDDEQLDAIADQFSIDDPAPAVAAILAKAAALRFPDSLAQWAGTDPDLPDPPLGTWPAPDAVEGTGLTVASDTVSGAPFSRVHILLIPTASSWEVPAYLRWGNWNACPAPEQHVAALRHWHERFGVELVGINRDTLNLRATRRPADRQAALALAGDQHRYCPDTIDQGAGSLSALAAILMATDWWFFWWD